MADDPDTRTCQANFTLHQSEYERLRQARLREIIRRGDSLTMSAFLRYCLRDIIGETP